MQKALKSELNSIITPCKNFLKKTNEAAGKYLHNLPTEEPDLSEVEKVIDVFPWALLQKNEDGVIPIQQNAYRPLQGGKYVAFVAKNVHQRGIGPETLSKLQCSSIFGVCAEKRESCPL